MKMKKLFAGLVATSMVAAMGTSAMAAVNSYALNPTVDEAGVVSISDADVAKLALYGDEQMTVIVIPAAAYEAGTISDDDIYYIDQDVATKEGLFQAMGLKCGADLIPEGQDSATYYVRIGGSYDISDGIYEGSFTVTKTSEDDNVVITVIWGDVNNSEEVELGDMNAVVNFILGKADTYGDYTVGATIGDVIWGDVNNSEEVELGDMNAVVNYILGKADTYGDYTVGQSANITITK